MSEKTERKLKIVAWSCIIYAVLVNGFLIFWIQVDDFFTWHPFAQITIFTVLVSILIRYFIKKGEVS